MAVISTGAQRNGEIFEVSCLNLGSKWQWLLKFVLHTQRSFVSQDDSHRALLPLKNSDRMVVISTEAQRNGEIFEVSCLNLGSKWQ